MKPPRLLSLAAKSLPPDDAWLSGEELSLLPATAVPKRRSEFRLGRFTAKTLLDDLLADLPDRGALGRAAWQRLEILPSPDGDPRARLDETPLACRVSISHAHGRALVAAWFDGDELGCDIELVEARSPELVETFFTETEARAWRDAPAHDRDALATLIWSAKESALKARRIGLGRDTRDVPVHIDDLPPRGGEWCRIEIGLGDGGPGLSGWAALRDGYALTLATAPRCEAPALRCRER